MTCWNCVPGFLCGIYSFLYYWQSALSAAGAVFFAWYQWEVMVMTGKMEKIFSSKGTDWTTDRSLNETDIVDLARNVVNLPTWLARKVFVTAIMKSSGQAAWKNSVQLFSEKLRQWKKNRDDLRRAGHIE
jgi:hypothetical protein